MRIQVLTPFYLDIGNGVQKLQAKSRCRNATPYDFNGIYYIDDTLAIEKKYYSVLLEEKYKSFVKILE